MTAQVHQLARRLLNELFNDADYPRRPRQKEEKYVEFDEVTGMWCVFGVDSGYAYSTHASEEDAKAQLTTVNVLP